MLITLIYAVNSAIFHVGLYNYTCRHLILNNMPIGNNIPFEHRKVTFRDRPNWCHSVNFTGLIKLKPN